MRSDVDVVVEMTKLLGAMILKIVASYPVFAGPGSPAMNSIPPSNPVPPHVAGFTPPLKSHASSGRSADSHQSSPKIQPDMTEPSENEPNLSDVQAPLLQALTACRQTVKVIVRKI